MKRIVIGAGIVLALGAIVYFSLQGERREKAVRVYVEAAEVRDIARVVKATGEVDPRVKVNLSAHVIGKIEKLFVEEGDRVEAGAPVLRLEQEGFRATRDRAAAELEIARSRVRQAGINVEDAAIKLRRAERLRQEGIASDSDLEAAQLQYRSQQLAAEQARETVLQAAAALEKAADDLDKTTIYAPLSGRVTALNAEEGEVVVSGTMNTPGSVIGTISDLSEILAEVDVDESEVAYLEIGQPAVVKVEALPDREFSARVVEIGSSGFQRPGNPDVTFFKAKLLLAEPDLALRPGMSTRVEIETARREQVVVVPVQSVVARPPLDADSDDGGDDEEIDVVFVVVDERSVQRPVDSGLADITHIEIVSGVEAGEEVVTGPYRSLKDLEHDDKVKVRTQGSEGDAEDDD